MWEDTEIVTLDMAKSQLRITHTSEDDDLELKVRLAHGIVFDAIYLSRRETTGLLEEMQAWTDETAPAGVIAAILQLVVHLWEFRGDDKKTFDGTNLPPEVTRYLNFHRDRVIA